MIIIHATEDDGIELLYRGRSLQGVCFQHTQQFNAHCESLDIIKITDQPNHSKQFNIPPHYAELDVEQYIRSLVPNGDTAAAQRVEQELKLFESKNLYPVLQLLIYIIDTMRKHNVVWGVGRGSSVASYCLYLIGVHKVDSIKYALDIREFLK
jgi:DNA polymerase III alpha subunit